MTTDDEPGYDACESSDSDDYGSLGRTDTTPNVPWGKYSETDPRSYGVGEKNPLNLGCGLFLGFLALALALVGANAARTPSSGTQAALAGGHPVAGVASAPKQEVPPTDTPGPVTDLPGFIIGFVATPSAAPPSTPAPATPEPQTPAPTEAPTHTAAPPTATAPHTTPPTPAPPQNCVATTITVTQSDGSSETVSGSGSSTARNFGFRMTGTTVTVHAADNPHCSPPHYKVTIEATDGSFANNCGLPSDSDTTSFKDGSPGEQATVTISQVQSCT
jgi:hypothetical protein